LAYRGPPFLADQGGERVRLGLSRVFPAQPEQRSTFSLGGSKVLQANVLCGLEDERGQGRGILEPAGSGCLQDPPEGLLGYVFRRGRIVQSPKRKQPEPLPELPDQRGFIRGTPPRFRHRRGFCRHAVTVTITFDRQPRKCETRK
jgi:hypothetical protein